MTQRDDHWLREGEEESEPDWAEQIRAGRKARGDRLRDVFASFDDDEGRSVSTPTKPAAPEPQLYDHEQEPPA
jgi:hypothetical protein